MSVTIKDIAKLANVSHTTVSRALNNSPLINDETKARIRDIAKTLNYTPNFNARSLVLDRSYNIGLFFSTLNTGTSANFFYEVVRGINSVIKEQFNLIVKGIDDYKDYRSISRKNYDGIIVMSQSVSDNVFIETIRDQGMPIIVLNRLVESNDLVSILSDDCMGAYKVVEYLLEQGHRKIAIIEGQEGFKSTLERKEGYRKALTDHAIPIIESFHVKGDYDVESGYVGMQTLLQLSNRPTAVFCSNDDMAVGALKAIQDHGLKVPHDISLAGFDDNLFTRFLSPALTTVRRPIEQISREGALRLLEYFANKSVSKEAIYLHTELIIRDSVRKIDLQIGQEEQT